MIISQVIWLLMPALTAFTLFHKQLPGILNIVLFLDEESKPKA